MKTLGRTLLGLFALAVCAGATSCKKGTYLELVFKGADLPPVKYIGLTLTLPDRRLAMDSLPEHPSATNVVKLPSSAAFQLDDYSGGLTISATAFDETNTAIGTVDTTTTIMHGETWTVELDFGGPDAAASADASPDLGVASDAGADGSLVAITDAGVGAGCSAATVQATESVSLDYKSSGQSMDSGDLLWAYLGPAEQYIGWMKFGVKFVPKGAHLTKATLNLFLSQVSGNAPTLNIDYSSADTWTRKSKASDVSNDGVISTGGPYLTPNAAPAPTPYALDVTNHDWAEDFTDGNITLGIENSSVVAAAVPSRIQFYGVNPGVDPDPTRPTLVLEFCQ